MSRRQRNNNPVGDDDDDDDDDDEDMENEQDDDDDDDDDDDPLQHLPEYVVARVEQLQVLHTNRESIMEQYLIERSALEKKYELLLQPIYLERANIIQGISDVPTTTTTIPIDQQITPPMNHLDIKDESKKQDTNNHGEDEIVVAVATNENDENNIGNIEDEEYIKGIPQFWSCAMTRIEVIGELLTVDDLDCLEHLLDIQCSEHDNGQGFTLSFIFGPNEYFTNTILTKSYTVPNLLTSDEPILKDVKGETIFWKTGKSLTHKTIKKKQRGKGRYAGQIRSVTKQEEKESFFHWFTTPEMPTSVNDMDEEEADQLEELFENDFEIAQAFRCNIIPHAVLWFTGQAVHGITDQLIEDAMPESTDEP